MGLRILLMAFWASLKDMILLAVIMIGGMIFFSTLVYYAEFNDPNQFPDIPTGFWWAIITMTTVGYGDMFPKSQLGYAVGAMCAMAGMVGTALPIPIIVNTYTRFYDVAEQKKRRDARTEHVTSFKDEMKEKFKSALVFSGSLMTKMTSVTSRPSGHRNRRKNEADQNVSTTEELLFESQFNGTLDENAEKEKSIIDRKSSNNVAA